MRPLLILVPTTVTAVALFYGAGLGGTETPAMIEEKTVSFEERAETPGEKAQSFTQTPLADTPAHEAPAPLAAQIAHAEDEEIAHPIRLRIPAIGLDSRVIGMGVNQKGEMDVPSGRTKDVGWYEGGTIPGELGSAVMDAHVYAAFRKLRNLKVGADIHVVTKDGEELRFKVTESMLYPYDQVPPYYLFERADGRRLNLITCAGSWSGKLGTYTKRLVVYAVLVE